MGSLARSGHGGSTNRGIPCCLEKLDTRRVRAHVIPIPHHSKATITIPLHIRANFLKTLVNNFPCSLAQLPQENANPFAGAIYIDAVLACDAWKTFGVRG